MWQFAARSQRKSSQLSINFRGFHPEIFVRLPGASWKRWKLHSGPLNRNRFVLQSLIRLHFHEYPFFVRTWRYYSHNPRGSGNHIVNHSPTRFRHCTECRSQQIIRIILSVSSSLLSDVDLLPKRRRRSRGKRGARMR